MTRLLYIAMLLLPMCCVAQRENVVWYFGEGAGVSFSTGSPVPVNGPLSTQEGTATICDASTGALLFTTDGKAVYNRTMAVMPNGFGLMGGWSSTQSALIVPMPDSPDKYYVFTPGDLSNGSLNVYGLHYNIVDMSLSGGVGDVAIKNVKLLDTVAEKLHATSHCDGKSYWVVAHDRMLPRFYMYRVTARGIDPPVISNVGRQYVNPDPRSPGGNYGLGMLKFSASGNSLAMTSPHANECEVFNVDLRRGTIQTPRLVDRGRPFYGLSFSPNENILYVTTWNEVLQYNMLAGSIPASRVNLGPIPSATGTDYRGGIQRGPDGVIYVADGSRLRRIPSPNTLGAACGYVGASPVAMRSNTRTLMGLPNIIDGQYLSIPIPICSVPVADYTGDTVACVGSCLMFVNTSTATATRLSWQFTGGVPNTFVGASPPAVCFNDTGRKTIRLIAENANGADTIVRVVRIVSTSTIDAGPDISICGDAVKRLQASGGVRYLWSPASGVNDATSANPEIIATSTTTFICTGWNDGGCVDSDTVVVTRGRLVIFITNDTAICKGTSVRLQASGGDVYRWWSDSGLTMASGAIVQDTPLVSTTYFVEVRSASCIDTAQVTVNVLTIPELSVSNDTVICAGQSITLTASATTPGQIEWFEATGVAIGTTMSIQVSPQVSNTYTGIFTSAIGCAATQRVVVNVERAVAPPDVDSVVCSGTIILIGGSQYIIERDTSWQLIVSTPSGCADTAQVNIRAERVDLVTDDVAGCAGSNVVCKAVSNGAVSWYDEAGVLLHQGAEYSTTASATRRLIVRAVSLSGCQVSDTILLSVVTADLRVTIGSGGGVPGNTAQVLVQSNVDRFPWRLQLAPTAPLAILQSATPGRVIADGSNGEAITVEFDSANGELTWQLYLGQRVHVPLTGTMNVSDSCSQATIQNGLLEMLGCAIQRRSVRINAPLQAPLQVYSVEGTLLADAPDVASAEAVIAALRPGVYIVRIRIGTNSFRDTLLLVE